MPIISFFETYSPLETNIVGDTWQYDTDILGYFSSSNTIVYPPPAPQDAKETYPSSIAYR